MVLKQKPTNSKNQNELVEIAGNITNTPFERVDAIEKITNREAIRAIRSAEEARMAQRSNYVVEAAIQRARHLSLAAVSLRRTEDI
jgi:hypothetical protein